MFHQKIIKIAENIIKKKTQINLTSLLTKFNFASSRERNTNKSLFNFSNIFQPHNIYKPKTINNNEKKNIDITNPNENNNKNIILNSHKLKYRYKKLLSKNKFKKFNK